MHHDSTQHLYRVTVGHFQITVKAASAEEAIGLAKRQLAHEMPRFYDVIRSLESTRFEVRTAAA